ncbi:hypothetical protein H4R35_005472, partial [Dimargaris xerosporica]
SLVGGVAPTAIMPGPTVHQTMYQCSPLAAPELPTPYQTHPSSPYTVITQPPALAQPSLSVTKAQAFLPHWPAHREGKERADAAACSAYPSPWSETPCHSRDVAYAPAVGVHGNRAYLGNYLNDDDDYFFGRVPIDDRKQIDDESHNVSFLRLALEGTMDVTMGCISALSEEFDDEYEDVAVEDGFHTPRNHCPLSDYLDLINGPNADDDDDSARPVDIPCSTYPLGKSLQEEIVRFNECSNENLVRRLFGYDPNSIPDALVDPRYTDHVRSVF